MSDSQSGELELLRRRAERERRARKEAESYLERKSLELYYANQQLLSVRHELEHRVEQRTHELWEANARLQAQMRDREELNRRMVELSHQAGKAEVATEVLHNVGNVLNSVNVSARVVDQLLEGQLDDSLLRVTAMLRGEKNLATFFSQDPRGKLLPQYIEKLAERNGSEIRKAREELLALMTHLEHIMAIVATQQENARISGLHEVVAIPDLMDNALLLYSKSLTKHRIEIVRDYQDHSRQLVERQKVMQVLLNLIKNAKEAINEGPGEHRVLTLGVHREDRFIALSVTDSGKGIAAENLTKIFHHGFTTRSSGHGFGLHSCANLAAEMGGELRVSSEGAGMGARFTIRLPYRPSGEEPQQSGGEAAPVIDAPATPQSTAPAT